MVEKKWIWQHKDYPNFKFNKDILLEALTNLATSRGKLEGILMLLGSKNISFLGANSTIEEIVTSFQIEGEIINKESVKSSILKKVDKFNMQKDYSTKHSDGLVEMFLDCSTNFEPLSIDRLNGWHNTLFPTGYSGLHKINVATFRKEDISVVSYKSGKEQTHYIAPPPKLLKSQIDEFLNYVNNSNENVYIKAAIAHFWFLTIHPFDDGNGRIARAITNYILAKESNLQSKYYSISMAISKDKKSYYDILESSQSLFLNKDLDLTKWILWHTNMIKNAIEHSLSEVEKVVQKAKFWERAREFSLNSRQIKVLNKILDYGVDEFEGGINIKKYISITKTSTATAKRDIADLVNKKLISKVEGSAGRNTRYRLNFSKSEDK
jgi:Fic family protein